MSSRSVTRQDTRADDVRLKFRGVVLFFLEADADADADAAPPQLQRQVLACCIALRPRLTRVSLRTFIARRQQDTICELHRRGFLQLRTTWNRNRGGL